MATEDDAPMDDDAMKELLNNWGGDDDDEDDDSSDDDDSEIEEREVNLQDNVVDHIVFAAADLEEGMAEFEKLTGCSTALTEAAPAFVIKGLGIRCARIAFGDSYLEIIAPNAAQPGPIGQLIKDNNISNLTLFHYAIRTSQIESVEEEVEDFGYTPDNITMFGGSATSKDGEPRKWQLLFLYGHAIGGMCPFFVKWSRNNHHPCARLAENGSEWGNLAVQAPSDDPIHLLMDHLGSVQGMSVEVGSKAEMTFSFTCPEGPVSFSAKKAVGFKFPGFDDDEDIEDDAIEAGDELPEPLSVQ